MRLRARIGWSLLPLALAAPALAVDGVREINQTCATTTGCFTGDSAGFPVTITLSGSYRLTSNLLIADTTTDVINVATANVDVDLNGFTIQGITVCSTPPVTCSPLGPGRGVAVGSSGILGLAVRNGTVAQMGGLGVYTGGGGRVENVRAVSNGDGGIWGGDGTHVLRCTVERSGFEGGILLTERGLAADNVVYGTPLFRPGIHGGDDSIIRGNTVRAAGGSGISSADGALVVGNTVSESHENGIHALGPARISGNTIRASSSFGIDAIGAAAAAVGCADNLLSGNAFGMICNDLGGNLCDGGPC